MCWRDDEPMNRYCALCGEEYYGDLGHRCPMADKTQKLSESIPAKITIRDGEPIIVPVEKKAEPMNSERKGV